MTEYQEDTWYCEHAHHTNYYRMRKDGFIWTIQENCGVLGEPYEVERPHETFRPAHTKLFRPVNEKMSARLTRHLISNYL